MSKYGTTFSVHGIESVTIEHTRWAGEFPYHSVKLAILDGDGNEFEVDLYNSKDHPIQVVTKQEIRQL